MPGDKDVMLAAARDAGLAIPADVDFTPFGATVIDETQDLRTPRLSIAQPTSDAVVAGEVQMGEFYYAATGRGLGKKIRFQILGMWMGRQFIQDREVKCRSNDLVTGDPGYTDPQRGEVYTECARCPASKWGGRSIPPICDKTYNYAVLVSTPKDPDKKWLAYLTLRRTTTDLAKKLNGDHIADGKPWFAYLYDAETLPQKNDQGNWWIITANRAAEATVDQMNEAYGQAASLVERIKNTRIEDVIEVETKVTDEVPI